MSLKCPYQVCDENVIMIVQPVTNGSVYEMLLLHLKGEMKMADKITHAFMTCFAAHGFFGEKIYDGFMNLNSTWAVVTVLGIFASAIAALYHAREHSVLPFIIIIAFAVVIMGYINVVKFGAACILIWAILVGIGEMMLEEEDSYKTGSASYSGKYAASYGTSNTSAESNAAKSEFEKAKKEATNFYEHILYYLNGSRYECTRDYNYAISSNDPKMCRNFISMYKDYEYCPERESYAWQSSAALRYMRERQDEYDD